MDRPDTSPTPTQRGARARWAVATVCGLGHVPFAPGTFGSLPGVLLYVLLHRAAGPAGVLAGLGVVVALGFWSAGVVEHQLGRRDPGPVVVDEVAGQLVALGFLAPTPALLATGFVLFRVLDVVKPPPARQLEALHGSSGIMLDDLVAGAYAAGVLHLLCWLAPEWFG